MLDLLTEISGNWTVLIVYYVCVCVCDRKRLLKKEKMLNNIKTPKPEINRKGACLQCGGALHSLGQLGLRFALGRQLQIRRFDCRLALLE